MTPVAVLALVKLSEFLFLPPICLAIALVTAAAHREDMRDILRHAVRAWIILIVGIVVFMVFVSYLFEWILPG
jgi:ABC-type sulfate transport system permease component